MSTPKPFELIAGHPTLDFVNTLDYRFRDIPTHENLYSYDDLLRFLTDSGLLSESKSRKLRRHESTPAERAEILAQAIALRETLATIGYSLLDRREIPNGALESFDIFYKQASIHRHLIASESKLEWKWSGLTRNVDSPLWLLAQSAADLLLSDQVTHLRGCASETCRWLFLDTSKNHTRRWCEMKTCGNRMKARRFQARNVETAI
jgi:predicted RNA-binding Zn ribbon-like protein